MFAKFIQRRRERLAQERFRKSFDYAAGQLLEFGDPVIEALELKVEESMCFGAFDEFDRGILSAIERFYMLTNV